MNPSRFMGPSLPILGRFGRDEQPQRDPAREAREAYVTYRRATRPFRRAFGGNRRDWFRLREDARKRWERDARTVREAIVLGARTVASASQRTGLPQARVRAIVKGERIEGEVRP